VTVHSGVVASPLPVERNTRALPWEVEASLTEVTRTSSKPSPSTSPADVVTQPTSSGAEGPAVGSYTSSPLSTSMASAALPRTSIPVSPPQALDASRRSSAASRRIDQL
jgi:hypothetical protein